MRDLREDELSHVYGGGGSCEKECKETNHGQEKKSDQVKCFKESQKKCS